nr:hypothetical protein CFP56_45392 [Quercus suber]
MNERGGANSGRVCSLLLEYSTILLPSNSGASTTTRSTSTGESRSHTLAPAPAPATGDSTFFILVAPSLHSSASTRYNGEAGSDGFQVLTPYVQSFFAALKVLSQKEVHYGSYATSEKVNAPETSICQEKMLAPVQLCCKHIFCEDCFRMV